MANFTSAQAMRILDVKNYVLRFWVGEMPLIQPKKDLSGHWIFSGRDMRLLLRLKYLLYERHLSIEEARQQMEKELSSECQDLRAELDSVRSDLLDLLVQVKE